MSLHDMIMLFTVYIKKSRKVEKKVEAEWTWEYVYDKD